MIIRTLYVFAILILQPLTTIAQIVNFSFLIDKKWVFKEYLIGGQILPASDVIKGDYSIFRSNHNVESKSGGLIQKSKWKFDTKDNILTLHSDETGVSSEMRIQLLTEKEFKFALSTLEGMDMIVIMRSE
jgi:hypothetical protein